MANTPNLDLERLVEGQASGEITHNSALNKLDSLVMGAVKDRHLAAQPGAPTTSARRLLGPPRRWCPHRFFLSRPRRRRRPALRLWGATLADGPAHDRSVGDGRRRATTRRPSWVRPNPSSRSLVGPVGDWAAA